MITTPMSNPLEFDPYGENILTRGLGPILSRQQALKKLVELPPFPKDISQMPHHIRMHYLMKLRQFHVPLIEGARLVETIDLMVRPNYALRDPSAPQSWAEIYGVQTKRAAPRAQPAIAVAVGHSGTGKTEAILRALGCYPGQVIDHDEFPHLTGRHAQVVWQSVDVPASGRSSDLAANLMMGWDSIMGYHFPDRTPRFEKSLAKDRRDGTKMLDEWRQVATAHFLGVLHLDEVQNFFKLPSLESRRKRKVGSEARELSIVEDQCLKWILSLTNTWQVPLILSGTPDGIGALTKRLSTIERVAAGGYHAFPLFEDPHDRVFLEGLFKQLTKYQFVDRKLDSSKELPSLLVELTGGIPRLMVALWIAAHRVAFERMGDDLRLGDFRTAARTYLAPTAPAIAALRSKDPDRMVRISANVTGHFG